MALSSACATFIKKLPKAELHVHFEGTMEAKQLLQFARRNNVAIASKLQEQLEQGYHFADLKEFLEVLNLALNVLQTEQDVYELVYAYLTKAASQGVLHTEIFFHIQAFMGAEPMDHDMIINGIHQALVDGKKNLGISGYMILCFIRQYTEDDALRVLDLVRPYRDKIIGIGLAAMEAGHPVTKFERAFARARAEGYRLVAHVAESCDGPAAVHDAIKYLQVERIDHGIRCAGDPIVVRELAEKKIAMTLCPLSNVALGCVPSLAEHPLRKLFDAGVMTTINSDDPPFFGGYIAENYLAAAEHMGFTCAELAICARYSFEASFLPAAEKSRCFAALADYVAAHECN